MTSSSAVVAGTSSNLNLSQVFVRSELQQRVQEKLEKKRRLEEKQLRKEERRNAKKTFKGFSQDVLEKKPGVSVINIVICLLVDFSRILVCSVASKGK